MGLTDAGWYRALNRWADDFERTKLPFCLQYNCWGDPASWCISHPAFCYLAAALGALAGWALSGWWPTFTIEVRGLVTLEGATWRVGAVVGAILAALYYMCIREPDNGKAHLKTDGWAGAFRRLKRNPYVTGIVLLGRRVGGWQVGWFWDGIGDFVGCWLLVVWPLYWILL